MGTGEFNARGNPGMDWHPIQGGVDILLVASCQGNQDKLRPDGPPGSYTETLPLPKRRDVSELRGVKQKYPQVKETAECWNM